MYAWMSTQTIAEVQVSESIFSCFDAQFDDANIIITHQVLKVIVMAL